MRQDAITPFLRKEIEIAAHDQLHVSLRRVSALLGVFRLAIDLRHEQRCELLCKGIGQQRVDSTAGVEHILDKPVDVGLMRCFRQAFRVEHGEQWKIGSVEQHRRHQQALSFIAFHRPMKCGSRLETEACPHPIGARIFLRLVGGRIRPDAG